MRAIALVDLDDTLFQTLRKCPPGLAETALTPLGYAVDGSPLSYATPSQMALIGWLCETTRFVPVTARGLDALRRVRIPFQAAVCAHGGVVLGDDGAIDAQWAAHAAAASHAIAPDLERLAGSLSAAAPTLRVRVLTEGETPLYVLAKHPDADDVALHAAVDGVADQVPPGWTIHRNGNNVAIMPPWLGKQHAVAHLLPRLRAAHPDVPVIGIGDSITDAPFMAQCDFAMVPRGSQLALATGLLA
ncbi:hypothetical protein ABC347_02295 [Sphingomonas sp. 1P06PA]|uniref:hypothetical protein n=1 Tax=Sphingomonas sp. 1P06PA TaxID=554121 RepID=UPI0039A4C00E